MLTPNSEKVLAFVKDHPGESSRVIYEGANVDASYATVKRILVQLKEEGLINAQGRGRGTTYEISQAYGLLFPIDSTEYFKKEIDEREIRDGYNFSLIDTLASGVILFTGYEMSKIEGLHDMYQKNISVLTSREYEKELERLAIDLSWKSAQIEGNTYSLLETERLLKEKETAQGKKKEEAVMLLNHKDALDFLFAEPNYISPLTVSSLEDVHSLLMKELDVPRNIRKGRVGITGTNYKPLDNEYQIREEMRRMCDLINSRLHAFEKAFLVLLLISYLQPFVDGNKRTARIVSNAILLKHGYCPISFRTVSPLHYKKAILLFYEQNNLQAFKDIFIEQYEFSVKTYF